MQRNDNSHKDIKAEQIYSLAKNIFASENTIAMQKLQELKKLLETTCIDEFFEGEFYMSAAARLAAEGNKNATKLLIELGANPDYAAYGAAFGEQFDFASQLHHDYFAAERYIVLGAGRANQVDYAMGWVIRNLACLDNLTLGLAWGGNVKELEKIVNEHPFTRASVAFGAVLSKQHALRKQYERFASNTYLAYAAGLVGDIEYAREILSAHGTLVGKQILTGLTAGGHFDLAEEFQTRWNLASYHLAVGAAQGGHWAYAENNRQSRSYTRLRQLNIDGKILEAASNFLHFDYLQYLMLTKDTATPVALKENLAFIISGLNSYFSFSRKRQTIINLNPMVSEDLDLLGVIGRWLANIHYKKFRDLLAAQMDNSNANLLTAGIFTLMAKQAEKAREIKLQYDITLKEAFAWKNSRDLRHLVFLFDELINNKMMTTPQNEKVVRPGLPVEIIFKIFCYLDVPIKLAEKELSSLFTQKDRYRILRALKYYSESRFILHKDRALSLMREIEKSFTFEEIDQLLKKQIQMFNQEQVTMSDMEASAAAKHTQMLKNINKSRLFGVKNFYDLLLHLKSIAEKRLEDSGYAVNLSKQENIAVNNTVPKNKFK